MRTRHKQGKNYKDRVPVAGLRTGICRSPCGIRRLPFKKCKASPMHFGPVESHNEDIFTS